MGQVKEDKAGFGFNVFGEDKILSSQNGPYGLISTKGRKGGYSFLLKVNQLS